MEIFGFTLTKGWLLLCFVIAGAFLIGIGHSIYGVYGTRNRLYYIRKIIGGIIIYPMWTAEIIVGLYWIVNFSGPAVINWEGWNTKQSTREQSVTVRDTVRVIDTVTIGTVIDTLYKENDNAAVQQVPKKRIINYLYGWEK